MNTNASPTFPHRAGIGVPLGHGNAEGILHGHVGVDPLVLVVPDANADADVVLGLDDGQLLEFAALVVPVADLDRVPVLGPQRGHGVVVRIDHQGSAVTDDGYAGEGRRCRLPWF